MDKPGYQAVPDAAAPEVAPPAPAVPGGGAEDSVDLHQHVAAAKENLAAGAQYVSEWLEVHEVNKVTGEVLGRAYGHYQGYVTDGPFSFKAASFLAGVAMVVFGIIGVFVEGGFMNTLLNFYQLLFGALTVGLESHRPLLAPELKRFLFEYFRFLFTLVGRGCFYVLVGVLIVTAAPWTNFLVGCFTIGTGFASLWYGYGAAKKLQALKGTVGDEVAARQTFARFDGDGDGKVSVAEFAALLQAVGCELTHHELEAAVALVGDMSDRTVSSDAFISWYKEHLLGAQVAEP